MGEEMMGAELLTPEAVAGRLAVSVKTVKEWLRLGKLRGVKLGGKLWRVKPEALEAFMAEAESVAAEEVAQRGP